MWVIPLRILLLVDFANCWSLWGSSSETCYNYIKDPVTFQNAQEKCAALGLKLASVKRSQGLSALVDLIDSDSWVDIHNPSGASCETNCGDKFKNVEGDKVTIWRRKHHPIDGAKTKCILIPTSDEGKVSGVSCDKLLPFVCERDCNEEVSTQSSNGIHSTSSLDDWSDSTYSTTSLASIISSSDNTLIPTPSEQSTEMGSPEVASTISTSTKSHSSSTTIIVTTPVPIDESCFIGADYFSYENLKHYKVLESDISSFHGAAVACEAIGLELATVDTTTDWQIVANFTSNQGIEEMWLSLYNPLAVACSSAPECDGHLRNAYGQIVGTSGLSEARFDIGAPESECLKSVSASGFSTMKSTFCHDELAALCESRCSASLDFNWKTKCPIPEEIVHGFLTQHQNPLSYFHENGKLLK